MIFTLDQINRAFFEALRLKLVALGHLPDVLIHTTEEAFKSASNALSNPLIMIYGVGNYKARQAVKNNKIVIDRLNISQGGIGLNETKLAYQEESQDYQEIKYQQKTENIVYQISYVCSENRMDNTLRNIIATTLDVRGKLKGVNENRTLTDNSFFYDKTTEAENAEDGFIERYMRYEVSNVILTEPQVTIIPRVETITIDTEHI